MISVTHKKLKVGGMTYVVVVEGDNQ